MYENLNKLFSLGMNNNLPVLPKDHNSHFAAGSFLRRFICWKELI